MVCLMTFGQLENSQDNKQAERVPFSLTHDALPLQNWNDGGG